MENARWIGSCFRLPVDNVDLKEDGTEGPELSEAPLRERLDKEGGGEMRLSLDFGCDAPTRGVASSSSKGCVVADGFCGVGWNAR